MNHQGINAAGALGAPAFSQSRFLVASCAAAATAVYLGAAWLRTPVFGLPTGVWMVGIAQGAAAAWVHRRRGASIAGWDSVSGLGTLDVGRATGRIGAVAIDLARGAAERFQVPAERLHRLEESLCVRCDAVTRSPRPLRIGVDGTPELARDLASAGGAAGVEWPSVWGSDASALFRRHALDAIVRHRPGEALEILTPEHAGREAAWYDWASARPLTYASLFPTRIDPARATIDDPNTADHDELNLISLLARAAAALSRTPGRLGLADRLRGRTPDAHQAGEPGVADRCLIELAQALANARGAGATPARRAAARVVSAWVASADRWLDMSLRRSAVDAALSMLGNEPEALLRAAAVRLAGCDDRAGLEALVAAERVIRSAGAQSAADHLPFLQGEVELGLPGPMTLGRVAAGIGLVCATSPASRLAYIRGDFMDDARYSAWLVGRDQDRAVLVEVFRALEEGRAEASGLRRAA